MVSFPNCKINIGLNITEKRTDGYHNLETVFFPVPFYDVLEIILSDSSQKNENTFTTSGIVIDANVENNICSKAYHLIDKQVQKLPAIKIHLHKNIPAGAGLGGGSANGAFMLKMLNEKFSLNLSEQQLIDLSLQLGSDCPFFIQNKPCYATGRGEIMTDISLDLNGMYLVLVNPGIHVSTAEAFSLIQPKQPHENLQQLIALPIEEWKKNIINDFEKPAIRKYPAIGDIKNKLYNNGALYASMTGSGSTVYGIFRENPEINFPQQYFIKKTLL